MKFTKISKIAGPFLVSAATLIVGFHFSSLWYVGSEKMPVGLARNR